MATAQSRDLLLGWNSSKCHKGGHDQSQSQILRTLSTAHLLHNLAMAQSGPLLIPARALACRMMHSAKKERSVAAWPLHAVRALWHRLADHHRCNSRKRTKTAGLGSVCSRHAFVLTQEQMP